MANECPKCQTNNPDTVKFCGECGTPIKADVGHTRTLETPAEELKRGTIFADRYEIIEELGTGGMGRVYRVADTEAKEEIALKLIRPEVASDKKTIERFRKELTTARKVRHKNICGMYDIGEYGGMYYISMEYVPGEDLKSLARRVSFDLPTAIKIARQVCEGLAEAHRLGVIHRDLKPSNIMIDKEGNARIMDFGIARKLEAKGITGAGVMIGTPEYMSPEQVEAKEVDLRSDIYALGVVLYEITTGRLPFEGDTPLSIALKHKSDSPKDPRNYAPHLSDELSSLILKCLEKDKRDRHQTPKELIAHLEMIEKSIPGSVPKSLKKKPLTTKEITISLKLTKLIIPIGLALVVCIIAFFSWRFIFPKKPELGNLPMSAIPFTQLTGIESFPTFSPDSRQIAFVWNGPEENNDDIYIKMIGDDSGNRRRLTTDPKSDRCPAWSPDSLRIAFVRTPGDIPNSKEESAIFNISPLGGREQKLYTFISDFIWRLNYISWSPDNKWLVFTDRETPDKPLNIWLLSVETLERKKLSSNNGTEEFIGGDYYPAVSPDGKTVAFLRQNNISQSDILLIPIEGGRARTLKSGVDRGNPLCWTPDSREVIYRIKSKMFRISAEGGESTPLTAGSNETNDLARWQKISPDGRYLAYEKTMNEWNIYRVEIAKDKDQSTTPIQWISSSATDYSATFSPDMTQCAFTSNRSGEKRLYISDPDGKNPTQLSTPATNMPSSWSPDGKYIALRGNIELELKGKIEEVYNIFIVNVFDGSLLQLTSNDSFESNPYWSKDGKWVYFDSDRSGVKQIWKIPFDGDENEAVQITQNGGLRPIESPDGHWIYFYKSDSGIWKVSSQGGEEILVLEFQILNSYWALSENGIYFINKQTFLAPNPEINYFNFLTGETETVLKLDEKSHQFLSISPDYRYLLFSQQDLFGKDILLVENWR